MQVSIKKYILEFCFYIAVLSEVKVFVQTEKSFSVKITYFNTKKHFPQSNQKNSQTFTTLQTQNNKIFHRFYHYLESKK